MPAQQYKNYISTTLNGAITSGAVSLVVSSATGFPTSGNFQIVIDNNEICQVTAVAGTTYTVTRAYEAINGVQVASAHSNGAPITLVLTVQSLVLGFSRIDNLVAGQVMFPGGSPLVAMGDSNLFWDNINKRLGVGVGAPAQPLHVVGNVRFGGASDFFWDDTNKRLGIGIAPVAPVEVHVATNANVIIQALGGNATVEAVNDAFLNVVQLNLVGIPVQIGAAGGNYHLVSAGLSPVPTNVQGGTTVTSITVSGTDLSHRVTVVTGTTPPAANVQIARINFASAYASEPNIALGFKTPTAVVATWYMQIVTPGSNYDLYTGTALGASLTFGIYANVIGN